MARLGHRLHEGDHLPARGIGPGREGGGHLARLAGGAAEEARQHLGLVLRRHHPGQLDHRGDAEPAVAEGRQDLRAARQEPGGGEPEEGAALGEAELAGQEGEEAGVAEGLPPAAAIEVREGEEEVGGGGALAVEEARQGLAAVAGLGEGGGRDELGEVGGVEGVSVHDAMVSRVSALSGDARRGSLDVARHPRLRDPLDGAAHAHRRRGGHLERPLAWSRSPRAIPREKSVKCGPNRDSGSSVE